jgi:Transposase DDE domain group 1
VTGPGSLPDIPGAAVTCSHFQHHENRSLRLEFHSAKDWNAVLDPIVARYRGRDIRTFFRGDAAFANPSIYEYLEDESDRCAIRVPANDVLHREIGYRFPVPGIHMEE